VLTSPTIRNKGIALPFFFFFNSANSSLSVVGCCQFHRKCILRRTEMKWLSTDVLRVLITYAFRNVAMPNFNHSYFFTRRDNHCKVEEDFMSFSSCYCHAGVTWIIIPNYACVRDTCFCQWFHLNSHGG
jgi:hypothetical protein